MTGLFVNGTKGRARPSLDTVAVIDDPAVAAMALDPVRSRLLSELAQPASAATLATRLGIGRQKVNYHLTALEAHDLVRVADTRQWGGLTERLLVATAASYVISPSAIRRPAVGELLDRPRSARDSRGR